MTVRLHRSPDPFPRPEQLAPLERHLRHLEDAADEYDGLGHEPTTAREFIDWLAVDIRRAAEHRTTNMTRELIRASSPCRRRQRVKSNLRP